MSRAPRRRRLRAAYTRPASAVSTEPVNSTQSPVSSRPPLRFRTKVEQISTWRRAADPAISMSHGSQTEEFAMLADPIAVRDHVTADRWARDVVTSAFHEAAKRPDVTSFFHEPTNTVSHLVRDLSSRRCAVIDSVLDYDAASGRTATGSADALIAFLRQQGLGGRLGPRDPRPCRPPLSRALSQGTTRRRTRYR
jgi:hypothetical protein